MAALSSTSDIQAICTRILLQLYVALAKIVYFAMTFNPTLFPLVRIVVEWLYMPSKYLVGARINLIEN